MSEPNWQPISQLSLIAEIIDGMADSAEEQARLLRRAEATPHVLDDATVRRLRDSYTEQQDDLWLFGEQLARWRALPLTAPQRAEVARLEGRLAALTESIATILGIVETVAPHTIERTLARPDADVGGDALRGPVPHGRPRR